ncbi:MAG TPA: hypothetical protein VK358_02345 [Longimicrobium sp.]|nr:hypothetical protein [Longimicrobium sp.]
MTRPTTRHPGARRYATTRATVTHACHVPAADAPSCASCTARLIPPGFGLAAPGYFWQERRCDRRNCRRWNLFIYRIDGAPEFAKHLLDVQAFDRREGVVGLARALVLAGVPQSDARALADAYAAQLARAVL